MNEKVSTHGASIKHRVLLIAGIVGFVGLFQWAYINWLSPAFDYYGFEYYPPPAKYLALAWILSAVPGTWMPLAITRPSQVCYWILYLTVFVPSMFIPLFITLNQPSDIATLMLTLFVGFAICGTAYLVPPRATHRAPAKSPTFWKVFGVLAALCSACVLYVFRGNIHFVSFTDIYDLREASIDLASGAVSNYSLMWLYGAINPFLVAYGIHYRKAWPFFAGSLGQVLVYSSFGTKASLLSVAFILAIHLLFRIKRIPFALNLTWGITILFAVLCVLFLIAGDEPNVALVAMMFLVFFRSFGLAGLLTGQYFNFIHHNPVTYYSHLKIISSVVHYPFQYPLGTEIGYYYYFPLVDTTAHFWATDGLAALGLPGILIASLACAALFWVIDSAAQRLDPEFAALAVFYGAFSLANLSLFTTFLSGGLGLVILLFYVMPPEKEPGVDVSLERAKPRVIEACPAP